MAVFTAVHPRRTAESSPKQRLALFDYLDDWWLPLFTVLMFAAAVIVANGTHRFYSYILPDGLDWFATAVLALGIPCLEFAAALATDWFWRIFYLTGMMILVGLESLAQYFQGQAYFVGRVANQFPDAQGIDIATLASESHGRWLVVAYIAILSLLVIFFGFAASSRFKTVRTQREARATKAIEHAELAHVAKELSEARATLTQREQELAQTTAHLTQARTQLAHQSVATSDASEQLRETLKERDAARTLAAQTLNELNEARAQLAHRPRPTLVDVIAHAQDLIKNGESVRAAAQTVGIAEATLRSRLNNA